MEYIFEVMKQLLIELDEDTVRRLEAVAPARSRKRSRFIREAIRRSLDAIEEERMAAAYRADPGEGPTWFHPGSWDPTPPPRPGPKRKRK